MDGEWKSVCEDDREMWMMAGQSAVRRALRRMFPMTQACSQVKWANVKARSSLLRSSSDRVGEGSASSIVCGGLYSTPSDRYVRMYVCMSGWMVKQSTKKERLAIMHTSTHAVKQ